MITGVTACNVPQCRNSLQPCGRRIGPDVFFVLCSLFVGVPSGMRVFVKSAAEFGGTERVWITHTGGVLSLLELCCKDAGYVGYKATIHLASTLR